jgi:predicted RNA-binding Zn ribbon-like protein
MRISEALPPGWTPPRFLRERLCLDFANTLDRRLAGGEVLESADKLADGYGALLAWAGAHGGVIAPGALAALAGRAAADPAAAAGAHAAALGLRAALLAILDALAEDRPVPGAALAALNHRLAAAPPVAALAPAEAGGFRHVLPGAALEEPLWPVAWSAAALLAEGEAPRVGRCQAPGCGWVFLDPARGRGRLWCLPETCGNRTRARRHQARRRGTGAGA